MNQQLLQHLALKVQAGLQRKSIISVSRWAELYRIMGQPFPGPWKTDHHPWLQEMLDCWCDQVVGQKAAQMGFTEVALNKCFFKMDIEGVSCLYVLPASTPDAHDFSARAFDPAVMLSPHLTRMFTDVKNLGHKRAGNSNLYIRGSRSRSQLKSIPVGFVVLDEVDEMVVNNIPLAFERMAGQVEKRSFLISTPTIANRGINSYYKSSSMEEFFFPCPHCSKLINLTFPESVNICGQDYMDPNVNKSHLICTNCKHALDHKTKYDYLSKGIWVPSHTEIRDCRGFNINQLYSMTVNPVEIVKHFFKSQIDPAEEQEFYNSKLGKVHAVKGAKVTDQQIEDCKGNYTKVEQAQPGLIITMGIDVGKVLHYEIDQWYIDHDIEANDINLVATPRVLSEGTVLEFEELDDMMLRFDIKAATVDIQPERRKSLEFAKRWPGKVHCCYYGKDIKGKDIKFYDEDSCTISIDRTSWLDISLGRFKKKKIVLPKDVSLDYREQIKAQVKVYSKDQDGNIISHYETGNEPDHFGHARNYAEVALKLCMAMENNYSIKVG
ncbi:MAG: phage terminase large subunit family protein [Proteobacteria bacterium]|jgi:hypothetical protein|nr:phage terminase large subunit family protein [Pseudomonadota bacterium]